MFPCRECAQEYTTRNNLRRHLQINHDYTDQDWMDLRAAEKESESNPRFACGSCDQSFSSITTRKRHRRNQHQEESGAQASAAVVCPECELNLNSHRLLVEHVARDHYLPEYTIENRHFNNTDEFEKWKIEKEEENELRWVRRSIKRAKSVYYYCREELRERYQEVSNPKRWRDTRQTCKDCTAHLIATHNEDGSVKISYCSKHFGHEANIANAILSEAETQIILQKLQTLANDAAVLDDIHDEYTDESTRMYYVDTDDIQNVRRKFTNLLEPWKRDKDDVQSVQKLADSDDYGIVEYVPPSDETGKNIRIVIVNKQQIEWAQKYGQGTIIADDTHHVSQYDVQLSTLMVLDSRDRGLPIAFMITKHPTGDDWSALFKAVGQSAPSFHPKVLMTDDSSIFYNGYSKAFPGRSIQKRLCAWHVTRSLNRKCASFQYSDEVTDKIESSIAILMRTAVPGRFRDRLRAFVDYIATNAPQFHEYFLKNYNSRVDQWNAVNRVQEHANVSMVCEAFHSVLKGHHLPRSSMIRLDHLIHILTQFISKRVRTVEISDARAKQRTYRQKQTNKRHTNMLNQFANLEVDCADEFEFVVKAAAGNEQDYLVIFVRNCRCNANNNIHCNACLGCPYSWICECPDSYKKGILCKHIHRVITFIRDNNIPFPHFPDREVEDTSEIDEIAIDDEDMEVDIESFQPARRPPHVEPTEEERNRYNATKEKARARDILRIVSSIQDRIIAKGDYAKLKEFNDEQAKMLDKYGKEYPPTSAIAPRLDRRRARTVQRGNYEVRERLPDSNEHDGDEGGGEGREEREEGGLSHLKRRKKKGSRHHKPKLPYFPYDKDNSTTCAICNSIDPPDDQPTGSNDIVRWRRCTACSWWTHEGCAEEWAYFCACGGHLVESPSNEHSREESTPNVQPIYEESDESSSYD